MKLIEQRWLVRKEPRPTKFGDQYDFDWVVTPYLSRRDDGTLLVHGEPVPFPTRRIALRYAREEMIRHYQRRTR